MTTFSPAACAVDAVVMSPWATLSWPDLIASTIVVGEVMTFATTSEKCTADWL